MGSQSKNRKRFIVSGINLAYIAGFLDGDGSLMIQVKKRKDSRLKTRFMLTICFYQDSRHEKPLRWIREILGIGYITKRNDGITELRINGYKQVGQILENLLPYIKFKKEQAKTIYKAAGVLSKKPNSKLSKKELLRLVGYIMIVQKANYTRKKKKTREDYLKILGLTP